MDITSEPVPYSTRNKRPREAQDARIRQLLRLRWNKEDGSILIYIYEQPHTIF